MTRLGHSAIARACIISTAFAVGGMYAFAQNSDPLAQRNELLRQAGVDPLLPAPTVMGPAAFLPGAGQSSRIMPQRFPGDTSSAQQAAIQRQLGIVDPTEEILRRAGVDPSILTHAAPSLRSFIPNVGLDNQLATQQKLVREAMQTEGSPGDRLNPNWALPDIYAISRKAVNLADFASQLGPEAPRTDDGFSESESHSRPNPQMRSDEWEQWLTNPDTGTEAEPRLSDGIELTGVSELDSLLAAPVGQLTEKDIALMNLACAIGLPGSDQLDMEKCDKMLDFLARYAQVQTDRNYHQFQRDPAKFNNSEAQYKVCALVTALVRDFELSYNMKRGSSPEYWEPSETFYADSKDIFIHGLIQRNHRMGTCSSLPVLFVAVGRRLGYPLKLATAREHLFARWDDGKEKFNFEGSQVGWKIRSDDHYKHWPKEITDEEIKAGKYLKSLNQQEELGLFLSSRAVCLLMAKRKEEAMVAYRHALRLFPNL